jgi:mycoredoxin
MPGRNHLFTWWSPITECNRAGEGLYRGMSHLPDDAPAGSAPVFLDVYWRPGCGYCGLLFRSLERAGIAVRRHNIWEDDEARQFVRAHNRGNETVPTVDLGGTIRTNPSPDALVEEIRASFPAMVGEAEPRTGWRARRRDRH